jgi:hypothetical protein
VSVPVSAASAAAVSAAAACVPDAAAASVTVQLQPCTSNCTAMWFTLRL